MIYNKIKERLYNGLKIFSFEFFPPKTPKGEEQLENTLEALSQMNPDFVSVTYGAGGSTREKTEQIVLNISSKYGIEVMPHLTCVGHSHEDIKNMLKKYQDNGITNILALRGDLPREDSEWQLIKGEPEHAIDIINIAQDVGGFTVGVAGFPEKHPEAISLDQDINFLKSKVNAGADFIITQLFFDNKLYFDYVAKARRSGITIPIIPGIMPITKVDQLKRFHEITGCSIPEKFETSLKRESDPKYIEEIGLAYCAAQCADLLSKGAPGIHMYTLNQSRSCTTIRAALQTLGYWDNNR